MIVIDIETSGLDFEKCGIWQIGALEFENPQNSFIEEGKIDEEDLIINSGNKTVEEITGKKEKELRNPKKQNQKQLLEKFFNWGEKIKTKNPGCQNPQFDIGFLWAKARKYNLKIPFHYRTFDLHSIAQARHLQLNKKFLIKEGVSEMGLTNTLTFCGMNDTRKAHNALEDARLTAECFARLLQGKNLLPEFKQFPLPEYLKN